MEPEFQVKDGEIYLLTRKQSGLELVCDAIIKSMSIIGVLATAYVFVKFFGKG